MPLHIIKKDITKLKVDAIVNTTNRNMIGYSGVDQAIHSVAGKELQAECTHIAPLELGQAKITSGYRLPCKYVIHTSGPIWQGGSFKESSILCSCYNESLNLAVQKQCKSIAFPLISSGVHGYPKKQALKYAIQTIIDFLKNHDLLIYICLYGNDSYFFGSNFMNDIKAFAGNGYMVDYDGKSFIKIFENKPANYRHTTKQAVSYSQMSAQEMYALGEEYYLGEYGVEKDYIKAVEWYRKAAEQGYAPAQNGLGYCYQYGQGVSQNYEKAIEWYIKAADQCYNKSLCNLGYCYKYGQGVPKDYNKAAEWFAKAADQGYAPAQNALGYCYQYGQGVMQDYKKAITWYTKAANQNHDKSQCNLGVCYYRGHGVLQDYNKAIEWYTKAAEQGYALAQYNLAVCYKNGQGVSKDITKAIEWYTEAAEQGDNDAKKALERLKERTQNSKRTVIHKPSPTSVSTAINASKDLQSKVIKNGDTDQSISNKEIRNNHSQINQWDDNNILYIYKNATACHARKHNITSATAIITGKNYAEIKLNVEYCEQCNRFYMSYTTYEHYRDVYGILLGNLRMYSTMDSGGAFLASESPLKLCCYSVSQTDGLSDRERQYIISQVIDKNILQKREVIRYLEYFINMNGKKRGNEIALSKWKADLAFTLSYKSEFQTHHYISTIKKY